MSFIDMTKNYQWSEADIVNAGRAAIYSQISFDRQQELQTIMLGHIAGMRTATMDELAEIAQVQAVTQAQVIANAAARCSARRPRSRRIAAACLVTSARKPAAALTQKSVVLFQIPSGPQKLRPASPVVMIRMPDVGLGVLASVLCLVVTAPKNIEILPSTFFSCDDIVMLCCFDSGNTAIIPV